MIDVKWLDEDRRVLKSLDFDFEGLDDDRVLLIVQALQVANRNTERWKAIAQDLFVAVTRLRAEKKQVTISLPNGVKLTCYAAAVGEVIGQLSPALSPQPVDITPLT